LPVARPSSIVVAAAIIMTGVFASFVLDPDPVTRSIGFALAFGVVVDAFVVRLTLVPAAMALLGSRAWSLPGWLDKLLPNVDIEGSGLERDDEADSGSGCSSRRLHRGADGTQQREPGGRQFVHHHLPPATRAHKTSRPQGAHMMRDERVRALANP
jgi:MMPL family